MIKGDRWHSIERIQSQRHLDNIPERYADLIRQAAKVTGFDVYIGEPTIAGYDDVVRIGVYTREPTRAHGPFWAKYHELKLEMEQ